MTAIISPQASHYLSIVTAEQPEASKKPCCHCQWSRVRHCAIVRNLFPNAYASDHLCTATAAAANVQQQFYPSPKNPRSGAEMISI